jgi:hypothetical protein
MSFARLVNHAAHSVALTEMLPAQITFSSIARAWNVVATHFERFFAELD